jgi:predicted RNA-binding Zn ribbon-like protein
MTFDFIGGALALDLVNTEIVVRGKPRDLLQTPADVAAWWEAARARHPDAREPAGTAPLSADDPPTYEAIKRLRASLRRLFEAVAERRAVAQADLDAVNGVLRGGSYVISTTADGTARVTYAAHDPAPLLLPVALSALRLLTDADPHRLHRCGNERCVLLFYDATKSATRRWCSVGCMNRARSSRRYRAAKLRASSVSG